MPKQFHKIFRKDIFKNAYIIAVVDDLDTSGNFFILRKSK